MHSFTNRRLDGYTSATRFPWPTRCSSRLRRVAKWHGTPGEIQGGDHRGSPGRAGQAPMVYRITSCAVDPFFLWENKGINRSWENSGNGFFNSWLIFVAQVGKSTRESTEAEPCIHKIGSDRYPLLRWILIAGCDRWGCWCGYVHPQYDWSLLLVVSILTTATVARFWAHSPQRLAADWVAELRNHSGNYRVPSPGTMKRVYTCVMTLGVHEISMHYMGMIIKG